VLALFCFGIAIIALVFVVRRFQKVEPEDRIVLLSEEDFETHVRFSDLPESDMENIPI